MKININFEKIFETFKSIPAPVKVGIFAWLYLAFFYLFFSNEIFVTFCVIGIGAAVITFFASMIYALMD